MRKIGVSPRANIRSSTEQTGGTYVFACKPNFANVAGDFNREAVEKETLGVIEACVKNQQLFCKQRGMLLFKGLLFNPMYSEFNTLEPSVRKNNRPLLLEADDFAPEAVEQV